MVSAFTRFPFFSDLLRELLLELDRTELQAVVKVPTRDFSTPAQTRILSEAVRQRRGYVGAILVAIEPEEHRDELLNFVGKFRKPVVFLDTEPPWNEEEYPQSSAFVGFDGCLGGRLAGEAVAAELGPVPSPRILIITGSYQARRQECFVEYIRAAYPGAEIKAENHGGFLRSTARDLARQHLEKDLHDDNGYDAVFCTNDTMALGVLDAIAEMGEDAPQDLVLVGYDAIDDAISSIARAETQFKNTVHQDRAELAEQAVVLFSQLLEGEEPKRVTRLKPTLHRVARVAKASSRHSADGGGTAET